MTYSDDVLKLKEALENMVFQFGYRGITNNDKPMIWCGGLSALESAFDALGWDNPHVIQEEGNTCEVEGCMNDISSQGHWGDSKLYLCLCSEHSKKERNNEPLPKVKQYALDRESKRDSVTGILPIGS